MNLWIDRTWMLIPQVLLVLILWRRCIWVLVRGAWNRYDSGQGRVDDLCPNICFYRRGAFCFVAWNSGCPCSPQTEMKFLPQELNWKPAPCVRAIEQSRKFGDWKARVWVRRSQSCILNTLEVEKEGSLKLNVSYWTWFVWLNRHNVKDLLPEIHRN